MRWPTIPAATSPTRASRSWPSASPTPVAPDGWPAPTAIPSTEWFIAQALAHDLAIVSNEKAFDRYGVTRLW